MNLVFESTEGFEKEINFFDCEKHLSIVNNINNWFNLLLSNPQEFYHKIEQTLYFKLRNDYESSLYILALLDWM